MRRYARVAVVSFFSTPLDRIEERDPGLNTHVFMQRIHFFSSFLACLTNTPAPLTAFLFNGDP
jgi:hypothetical protein